MKLSHAPPPTAPTTGLAASFSILEAVAEKIQSLVPLDRLTKALPFGLLEENPHVAPQRHPGLLLRTFKETAVTSEAGLAPADGAAPCWPDSCYFVLDPIHGTKGFIRRPQFAIGLRIVDQTIGRVECGTIGCLNLPQSTNLEASMEAGKYVSQADGGAVRGGNRLHLRNTSGGLIRHDSHDSCGRLSRKLFPFYLVGLVTTRGEDGEFHRRVIQAGATKP